jgi:hypothetical protein
MPSPAGYVRTFRDNLLLAYVGVARYASAEQVHQLFFGGASKKQTYRRLAKLCEPGGQPGEGACLRRLTYRRRDGVAVPVWALAPDGRAVASRHVPWLRPPAASDIGARFLEHTLVLNDVLMKLVVALRKSSFQPLSDLPFRWLCEDDDSLSFQLPHAQAGRWVRSVLKPDAIMTIPIQQRRLFLEAETGSQSIATAHPDKTGAVLSKLGRYRSYFTDRSDDGYPSWYRSAFPEDLEPRLVFLVHSDERRRKVQKAVTERLGMLPPPQFKVLVMTFAEAPAILSRYIREGVAEPAKPRRERVVTVEENLLDQVRDGYNALAESLNAHHKVINDHNQRGGPQLQLPVIPSAAIRALRAFVKQVQEAGVTPEGAPAASVSAPGPRPPPPPWANR